MSRLSRRDEICAMILSIGPLLSLFTRLEVGGCFLLFVCSIMCHQWVQQQRHFYRVGVLGILVVQLSAVFYLGGFNDEPDLYTVPVSLDNGVHNPPFGVVVLYAWKGYKYAPHDVVNTIKSICRTTEKSVLMEILIDLEDPPPLPPLTPFLCPPVRVGVPPSATNASMVAFVAPGVTFEDGNWLNLLFRELFADEMRVAVPIIADRRTKTQQRVMTVVDNYMRGWGYDDGNAVRVPVLPQMAVLAMRTTLLSDLATLYEGGGPENLPSVFRGGRFIELSMTTWLCGGNIYLVRNAHGYIEDIDTASSSRAYEKDSERQVEESLKLMDWAQESVALDKQRCHHHMWFFSHFFDEFLKFNLISYDSFLIKNVVSGECIEARGTSLSPAPCDPSSKPQRFFFFDDYHAIRSLGTNLCLDAGSADAAGSLLGLFDCSKTNINQNLSFHKDTLRLVWGSFCIDTGEGGKVSLQYCRVEAGSEMLVGSQRLVPADFRTEHVVTSVL